MYKCNGRTEWTVAFSFLSFLCPYFSILKKHSTVIRLKKNSAGFPLKQQQQQQQQQRYSILKMKPLFIPKLLIFFVLCGMFLEKESCLSNLIPRIYLNIKALCWLKLLIISDRWMRVNNQLLFTFEWCVPNSSCQIPNGMFWDFGSSSRWNWLAKLTVRPNLFPANRLLVRASY